MRTHGRMRHVPHELERRALPHAPCVITPPHAHASERLADSSEGPDELENEECADMDSEANAYSAVGSQASTIYNTIGTHGTTDTTEHGHSSTRNSTNSLSCADHVSSTQHVSSVPSAARAGRDSFASLHLPRLQRAVRERLQREAISKARRHTSRLPPSSRLSLPPNLGASTAHDLISRVQRRFRCRLDSQRHAALAIERFYMRQRQRQAKAAADKKRLATLPSHDEESHSHNHDHQQQHEHCHPHEQHDQFLLEQQQQQQQQTPHEQQHLPHQRHRPHSQPQRGLLPSQSGSERARPRPSLLQAQFAQRPASPRGEAVIRSAQVSSMHILTFELAVVRVGEGGATAHNLVSKTDVITVVSNARCGNRGEREGQANGVLLHRLSSKQRRSQLPTHDRRGYGRTPSSPRV
eukprot:6179199-Pleurochrysis_carterae.AAC.2